MGLHRPLAGRHEHCLPRAAVAAPQPAPHEPGPRLSEPCSAACFSQGSPPCEPSTFAACAQLLPHQLSVCSLARACACWAAATA